MCEPGPYTSFRPTTVLGGFLGGGDFLMCKFELHLIHGIDHVRVRQIGCFHCPVRHLIDG